LEVVASLLLLLFLAPVLVSVAILIKLQDGGPVLYGHRRLGKGGEPFNCLKFRSMSRDADAQLAALLKADPSIRAEWARDQKLRADPRITAIGRFLRKSSLDELPQFFNVIRGEMSLVGPRPIVAQEVCRYGRYFRHYCMVRPGITGLWQVSGRSEVDYRRRVALDVLYVRHRSLALNLFVLLATVPAVLRSRGAH
jgi:lipopolysaccharide/colanic/teichoic acid biosynthesis glycosyltransferase